MKVVLNFLLYAALFFVVIFAITYGAETWAFHSGKNMQSMLVESGVAAAVFAVFLCMVAGPGRTGERAQRQKKGGTQKRGRERIIASRLREEVPMEKKYKYRYDRRCRRITAAPVVDSRRAVRLVSFRPGRRLPAGLGTLFRRLHHHAVHPVHSALHPAGRRGSSRSIASST